MKKREYTMAEYILVISLLGNWRSISNLPHGDTRETQSKFCSKLLETKEEFQGRTVEAIRQCFHKFSRITLGEYDYNKLTDKEKTFYNIHNGLEDII